MINLPIIGKQYSKRVNITKSTSRNALIHLPDDYETSDKKYPLLVFHCGSGETTVGSGKGAEALLTMGPARLINEGNKFQIRNPNTSEIEKFIVVSVQQDSTGYVLSPEQIVYIWENDPLLKDRVDTDAIFITGLSLGGRATCYFFEDSYADNCLSKVTALVPMSAQNKGTDSYSFNKINELGTPVWAFCGTKDDASFLNFNKKIEAFVKSANVTWYNAGHSGWHEQYKKMELYEWMLAQVKRNVKEPPKSSPVVIGESDTDDVEAEIIINIKGPAITESTTLQAGNITINYEIENL
ncbi:MAG: hypothetical protein KF862_07140 [Chitinophagaceae bacterium]|nr:hypothetical protein [Chitinophagaceae bacterium]